MKTMTIREHKKHIDKILDNTFCGSGERSANVDLTLYADGCRIALIEFKALNPGNYEHMKDTLTPKTEII